MFRQIPQPPVSNSPSPREIKDWMIAVTAYLRETGGAGGLRPTPILFESLSPSSNLSVDNAKATINGLVMYDAEQKTLVVAVDGAWVPLAKVTP